MAQKVAFYTFGCRLNQAETAIMNQGFEQGDYQVVDYHDSPDVLVINTCTVTENGDARTHKLVNKVRRLNPNVQVALVGCQAQVQKEKLLELPNVRWVVGNQRKMELEKILRETASDAPPQLITPTIQRKSFTIPFVGFDQHHTRANLKIQDGCDFFCTFCEIPFARGRARSREFEDILNEARQLAAAGHHELIITGINIGTYNHEGKKLADVLSSLEKIDDLWRIRIASIEPTTIADEVVQMTSGNGKLCRFMHIPIQAATDEILQSMQRKYSLQTFVDFLRKVHFISPDACLGTDIIVGFPGETDELFEAGYQLLLELPFAYFHVFSYSDRDHAKSSKYPNAIKVPREKIADRSRRLRELSARKRRVYHQKFLGKTENVLFEHKKNGNWSGLTDTYIRVKVQSNLNLKNKLVPVLLERTDEQGMIGTLQ